MYKLCVILISEKGGSTVDLIEFLEAKKREKNLTTLGLSREIGVSQAMLYFVLNKKRRAGVITMRKIAKYYDMDIETVVKLNDNIKQT